MAAGESCNLGQKVAALRYLVVAQVRWRLSRQLVPLEKSLSRQIVKFVN